MAHTVPANIQTLIDNADLVYDLMSEKIVTGAQQIYSGAVVTDARVSELAKIGGIRAMPFLRSIDTIEDQIIATDNNNTVQNLSSGQDQAITLLRMIPLGQSDLVKIMSNKDPLAEAATTLSGYWFKRMQVIMNSQLKGVFKNAEMVSDRTLDISALSGNAAKISLDALIDASTMLGERMSQGGVYAMHSKAFAKISKDRAAQKVISVGGEQVTVYSLDGKSIILNDTLYDAASEDYTTFFLGSGAFALGQAQHPVALEYDRMPLVDGGTDVLVSRMQAILHPVGIKFTGASLAKETPTNAELETASNWVRAYDMSNIMLAKLVHKV